MVKIVKTTQVFRCLKRNPVDRIVYLDDETLEKKGVLALGARRKLLKAFGIVIDYKERDLIDRSAYKSGIIK